MEDFKENDEEHRDDHHIQMSGRERIHITGVRHVDNFNDVRVVLETVQGRLTVSGQDLNIKKLDLEDGEFVIDGQVDALEYADSGGDEWQQGGSLLERLFR